MCCVCPLYCFGGNRLENRPRVGVRYQKVILHVNNWRQRQDRIFRSRDRISPPSIASLLKNRNGFSYFGPDKDTLTACWWHIDPCVGGPFQGESVMRKAYSNYLTWQILLWVHFVNRLSLLVAQHTITVITLLRTTQQESRLTKKTIKEQKPCHKMKTDTWYTWYTCNFNWNVNTSLSLDTTKMRTCSPYLCLERYSVHELITIHNNT